MNPESNAELLGRIAALELVVAQALGVGLVPLRNRADLIEEWRLQFHARVERLSPEVKPHATSASDRLLFAALARAEDLIK